METKTTQAPFIVGLMKAQRSSVMELLEVDAITDFKGCSEMYVQEKIQANIQALKMLSKHVANVNKRQENEY